MRTLELRDVLRAAIALKMRKVADELSSGRAADFSEYKRGVGRIQGLRDGLDAVDEVFKQLLDEQDD